jgi:hypothetical protein
MHLKKIGTSHKTRQEQHQQKLGSQLKKYREGEVIMSFLNQTWFIYLSTFPTMLFTILAFTVFGAIRLWSLDAWANLIFPVCGFRCTFEGVTCLTKAGHVNMQSKRIKQSWRWMLGNREEERFKKSCKIVTCAQSRTEGGDWWRVGLQAGRPKRPYNGGPLYTRYN